MIGDDIAKFDDRFAELFERDAEVRNYTDPADGGTSYGDDGYGVGDDSVITDEYGQPTDADGNYGAELFEAIATTAQLEQPNEPEFYSRAHGIETPVEAEILISSDQPVESADGGDHPYATEIVIDGDPYRALHVVDEGNGTLRVFAERISGVRA